jgi:hypothetical protein
MTALEGGHEFRLYRSGYSGPELPWSDNQQWAARRFHGISATDNTTIILEPSYGSAASLYRVNLTPAESALPDWVSFQARLEVDAYNLGEMPLAWYVGSPADWPSGIARFPEVHGPVTPARRWPESFPAGVWTLAVRRAR